MKKDQPEPVAPPSKAAKIDGSKQKAGAPPKTISGPTGNKTNLPRRPDKKG